MEYTILVYSLIYFFIINVIYFIILLYNNTMYALPMVNGVAVNPIIIMIKAKYYLCKNLFFKLTCPLKK